MRIKNILVVGGGSSGWMTAAALSSYFKDQVKVSLVESKNVPIVGVGESTLLQFNNFLKLLKLKDEDWMPHCNATYKASIRFTDFYEKGKTYEYPFGDAVDDKSITEWAFIASKYDLDHNSFAEYHSDNYYLVKHNKLSLNSEEEFNYNFDRDLSYHLDATAFGQFLRKKVCEPNNVRHFTDDIVSVTKDEYGYLTSVVGDSGTKYEADLFIDCTGFKSLLLEKEMNSEFLSYKDWLSNDRAIATKIPYTNKETQINNVTNCTALSSGWSWNIPLWNRVGTGYVYSSDFIDDDSAEEEFKSYLGVDDIDIKKINIRHGIRKDGWVKNVVGVGLSYGFIEPLESTGLLTTHQMIENIIEILDRTNFKVTGLDIDGYNYSSQTTVNGLRNFVSMHYKMSSRNDSPYWRYQTLEKNWIDIDESKFCRTTTMLGGTSYTNEYDALLQKHSWSHQWPSDAAGLLYVLSGNGHRPFGNFLRNKLNLPEGLVEKIYSNYVQRTQEMDEEISKLPSTYEFLKEHVYS